VAGGRLVVDDSNITGRMRHSVFPHNSGHHRISFAENKLEQYSLK
jgi:hypothetical protein